MNSDLKKDHFVWCLGEINRIGWSHLSLMEHQSQVAFWIFWVPIFPSRFLQNDHHVRWGVGSWFVKWRNVRLFTNRFSDSKILVQSTAYIIEYDKAIADWFHKLSPFLRSNNHQNMPKFTLYYCWSPDVVRAYVLTAWTGNVITISRNTQNQTDLSWWTVFLQPSFVCHWQFRSDNFHFLVHRRKWMSDVDGSVRRQKVQSTVGHFLTEPYTVLRPNQVSLD